MKTGKLHNYQLHHQLLEEFARASQGIHATAHPSLLLLDRATRAHPRQRPIPKTLRESRILLVWAGEAVNLLEQCSAGYDSRNFQCPAAHCSRSKPMPYTPAVPTAQHWHWLNIRNIAKVIQAASKKRSRYLPATDSRMAVKEGRRIRVTWTGLCALEADAPNTTDKWDTEEPYVIDWLDGVLMSKHFQYGQMHRNNWRNDQMPEGYFLRVFGAAESFLAPVQIDHWPPPKALTGTVPFLQILAHWRKIRDSTLSGAPPSMALTDPHRNMFTPLWFAKKSGWT